MRDPTSWLSQRPKSAQVPSLSLVPVVTYFSVSLLMNRYQRFLEYRDELKALFDVAVSDITACNSEASETNLQFWRRTQHRTVFATIEALCSHLKRSALMFDMADDSSRFAPIEQLALEDKSYRVTETGDVEICNAKIGLRQNICFALRAFARSLDRADALTKDCGWKALLRSIETRDRLTHPKTFKSYEVTSENITDLLSAWEWFWRHAIDFSRKSD